MGKKKKSFKHDPLWAKAKDVCRLNQEDIAMAKELGLKPRSLMKNNPSPSQQWKQPVKFWIRNLHEKRFGARDKAVKQGASQPAPKPRAAGTSSPIRRFRSPRQSKADDDDLDPWDEDEENFHAFAAEMLPQVEFFLPLQNKPEDAEWQQMRLGRRQKNLCWTACSLTARLREVAAVDTITLFGSVATSIRRPFGQPWDGPEGAAVCHTLNLALWVNAWDVGTLCTLDLIVRQTLASLADVERIAFGEERLELLLLNAETDEFLGRLMRAASADLPPSLDVPPDFVFRIEPLREPQAVRLFERNPPPPPGPSSEDMDIPF